MILLIIKIRLFDAYVESLSFTSFEIGSKTFLQYFEMGFEELKLYFLG